jgi:hypothetical protein
MEALDAQSLTYDLKLEQDTELIRTVAVHLAVSATRLLADRGSELLAHWHARLEEVVADTWDGVKPVQEIDL